MFDVEKIFNYSTVTEMASSFRTTVGNVEKSTSGVLGLLSCSRTHLYALRAKSPAALHDESVFHSAWGLFEGGVPPARGHRPGFWGRPRGRAPGKAGREVWRTILLDGPF